MATVNVDIDGVLYDFVGAMRHEMAINGFDPKPEDPLMSLHGAWGVTRETFEEVMYEGIRHGRVFGPSYPDRLIEGARDALVRLSDEHFIRLVTAKGGFPPPLRVDAIRNCIHWLADNDIPFDDIAFVTHHKTGYLADVVIDDRPEPSRWAQAGALNLLFTQPHNRVLTEQELLDMVRASEAGITVVRASDWPHAVELIERRFS